MAGKSKGWHLVPNRFGIYQVRWQHDGIRKSLTTGERDISKAREVAARLYVESIAGKKAAIITAGLPSRQSTQTAIAAWIDAVGATHDPRTVKEFELNAEKHWLSRWSTLGIINAASIAEYQEARLREVTRETTRKHMVALRTFLTWCKSNGLLSTIPEIPAIPKRAAGKRARPERKQQALTRTDIKKLLAALPEWSSDNHGRKPYRVRDYVAFAWETSLRPATLAKLKTPEHFLKGRKTLRISADVDKARFDREVPLSATAVKILLQCLPKEPGLIFGDHEIADYLEVASKKALGRVIRPYDLRHARITHLISKGADLLGVQQLAGHKDLATTAKYAHTSFNAAKRALAVDR